MSPKTKNILSWILSIVLALGFAGAGAAKLLGAADQLKNLTSWGFPLWLRYPIGLGELLLAVGVLLPRFRSLALYGVFGWALVAVFTHVQAGQAALIGPAIGFAVLGALDLVLWKKASGNPAYSPDLSIR